MKQRLRILASLITLGLLGLPVRSCDAAERPNILLIFGDECGIDWFGCYGSDRAESLTPKIDALAESGVRFTHCFSTPLCGPSRCLLITGRYGFHTGGTNNRTAHDPSYREEPSVARILKGAGYATGMAGK